MKTPPRSAASHNLFKPCPSPARWSGSKCRRKRLNNPVVPFKSPADPPQCCGNPPLLCRGTRSSNPSPSSGESPTNRARRARRRKAAFRWADRRRRKPGRDWRRLLPIFANLRPFVRAPHAACPHRRAIPSSRGRTRFWWIAVCGAARPLLPAGGKAHARRHA